MKKLNKKHRNLLIAGGVTVLVIPFLIAIPIFIGMSKGLETWKDYQYKQKTSAQMISVAKQQNIKQ